MDTDKAKFERDGRIVCINFPAVIFISVLINFPSSFLQIRKLRRELESAQEKVATLTTQLSTNVSFWLFNFLLCVKCQKISDFLYQVAPESALAAALAGRSQQVVADAEILYFLNFKIFEKRYVCMDFAVDQ